MGEKYNILTDWLIYVADDYEGTEETIKRTIDTQNPHKIHLYNRPSSKLVKLLSNYTIVDLLHPPYNALIFAGNTILYYNFDYKYNVIRKNCCKWDSLFFVYS